MLKYFNRNYSLNSVYNTQIRYFWIFFRLKDDNLNKTLKNINISWNLYCRLFKKVRHFGQ